MKEFRKSNLKLAPSVLTLPNPFVWVLLCLLITLQGCLNKDSEMELALTKELIKHKTDNVMSIDLRTIFGTQWKKVCLQSPYMQKTYFEKLVGENVRGFDVLDDDRFTLWVFYTDGHTSRVDIGNAVMHYGDGGAGCTSSQQPYLYFSVIGGEKKYFFSETGERK